MGIRGLMVSNLFRCRQDLQSWGRPTDLTYLVYRVDGTAGSRADRTDYSSAHLSQRRGEDMALDGESLPTKNGTYPAS